MATAIVSTAFARAGLSVPADGLLAAAGGGYAVLLLRAAADVGSLPRQVRDPDRAFGLFTFPAASTLLGERFHQLGLHPLGLALVVLGGLAWLMLAYAVPAATMLRSEKAPFGDLVSGSWLLWVVATESVATGSSMAAIGQPDVRGVLVPAAGIAWAIGIVLYLLLMTMLTSRLLVVDVARDQLSPTYWIGMGATAIITLAGARLLQLPHGLPIIAFETSAIGGLTFVFWAFGTFWIPLLLIGTIWREAAGGWRLRYELALWSVVFPLGMYAEASAEFGAATHLSFIGDIGRVMLAPAAAAWLVTALSFAASVVARRPCGSAAS